MKVYIVTTEARYKPVAVVARNEKEMKELVRHDLDDVVIINKVYDKVFTDPFNVTEWEMFDEPNGDVAKSITTNHFSAFDYDYYMYLHHLIIACHESIKADIIDYANVLKEEMQDPDGDSLYGDDLVVERLEYLAKCTEIDFAVMMKEAAARMIQTLASDHEEDTKMSVN